MNMIDLHMRWGNVTRPVVVEYPESFSFIGPFLVCYKRPERPIFFQTYTI